MHRMQLELESMGHTVDFVSVNATSALDDQPKLVARCQFPLLQDQEDIDVWGLMKGRKDDFYILDAGGKLARYLPTGDEDSPTNLSTSEGYATLLGAVVEVLQ